VLVIVTEDAAADLQGVIDYLQELSPGAASRMAGRLRKAMADLERLPARGKTGLRADTRELTTIWPYVIVYRITPTAVQILRVLHGAQDR
jgi:plasmid stabilization system protein ParE